jgi:hypothetical protein
LGSARTADLHHPRVDAVYQACNQRKVMRNARPRCPEAVVGLANHVLSEELNKLILAISYAVLVPLVNGVRPLQKIR